MKLTCKTGTEAAMQPCETYAQCDLPLTPLPPLPFRSNSSLLVLDISNTGAGISGIISVCTALGETNSTLQSLDLGRPQIKGNQVGLWVGWVSKVGEQGGDQGQPGLGGRTGGGGWSAAFALQSLHLGRHQITLSC